MEQRQLIRMGAICGVTAGVLRTVSSFDFLYEGRTIKEILYCLVDLNMLFAIVAIQLHQTASTGKMGFAGFVLALGGTAFIAGPDAELAGVNSYQVGAPVVGLGFILLSIAAFRARTFPSWVPLMMTASVLIGSVAFASPALSAFFVISGAGFGVALTGFGVSLLGQTA